METLKKEIDHEQVMTFIDNEILKRVFGKILISFEAGKVTLIKVEESFKIKN